MKTKKTTLILPAALLALFAGGSAAQGGVVAPDYRGERILYAVTPVGKTEYRNLGMVDLEGARMNLITLKTKALMVEDTEKVYNDPETLLPRKIEREVSGFWGTERITEEYDQKKGFVTIKKFKNGTQVSTRILGEGGPMHSAILLPFYLREHPNPQIGMQMSVTILPNKFKVELVSIDRITVPAGTFQAYHFKSMPDKFEVWINKDSPRVPLKIQGKGIFSYALSMQEYAPQNS